MRFDDLQAELAKRLGRGITPPHLRWCRVKQKLMATSSRGHGAPVIVKAILKVDPRAPSRPTSAQTRLKGGLAEDVVIDSPLQSLQKLARVSRFRGFSRLLLL